MKLTEIKVDGGLQSRSKINEEVIKEYTEVIRNGGKMPPVIVFNDGTTYHLADGWHRYFAHKQAGFADIEADIREGTRRDAVLYSVGANNSHGLRRTNADKKKAVMTLLEDFEWSEWNNAEIAKACGVSAMFVGNLRKNLDKEVPKIRKVKRGDTEYELDTTNLGTKAQDPEYVFDENEEMPDSPEYWEGYINKEGIYCCGYATFCAIGLPNNAEWDSLEDAKKFIEGLK
jgi:hypothetical protein